MILTLYQYYPDNFENVYFFSYVESRLLEYHNKDGLQQHSLTKHLISYIHALVL